MADESTAVVAESPEAPSTEVAPSETIDQTGEQLQPQPQPINWRARMAEDPEFAKFVQEESNRLFQKNRDKERRATAKRLAQEVDTAPDDETRTARATELAKLVAAEEDPDDRDNAAFIAKARTAEAFIARLRNTDEYGEIWSKHGKAEMDRRWHQDPEEYADWVWEQIKDLQVERRAKAKAGPMAEATAQDLANQRLRNLPTPVTGAGGPSAGGMTLDRLLNLSHADRTAWKSQHKAEYDQLVNALAAAT